MGEAPGPVERQRRVIEALKQRSAKLAGVYGLAVGTLEAPPTVGSEAARVAVICHCMREVMLGLPAAMADSVIPRPKPSSSALVGQLPRLLSRHPDVDLAVDQDIVPVPRAVARAFADLVTAAAKEQGRNRSNTAALITGGSDAKHPAINHWMDAYKFFVHWAHLDRGHEQDREPPSDEHLLASMRVVEDVVEVRTRLFFDNVRSVEGVLAEINALSEEEE